MASDEQVLVRQLAAAGLDADRAEKQLLMQGSITRPDPLTAGATQERPLLLLREGLGRFDLDLNVGLEALTTSRGNVVPRGVGLAEATALWLRVDPERGFQEMEQGSTHAGAAMLLAGNTGDSTSPREADPLLALLLEDPDAIGGWRGITPLIWSDVNTDGVIDDGELNPFGIYAGDLHVFDADGDGFGDLATIGFGAGTRRAADGSTLAIPETNLFLFHTMLEDGTPILRDAGLDLYGLANGTISSGDRHQHRHCLSLIHI